MENFNTLIKLAEKLSNEADAYQEKATKASSKRMRDYINQIKKLATMAKQELIQQDKGE